MQLLNTKILLCIAGTLIAILTAIGVEQHRLAAEQHRLAAERAAIEKQNEDLFKEIHQNNPTFAPNQSKAYQFKLP